MRLSGDRFDAAGMPADSLVEVAALEDILRSLVKLYWHDRNKNRVRAPKGYNNRVALRLRKIGEGCAVPLLEYDPGPEIDDLFSESELTDDFDRARDVVEAFITYAQTNTGEIPNDIRRLPVSKIKKFGQSLQQGEAIQIASDDHALWDNVIQFTPRTRSSALVELTGEYTQTVAVDGQVVEFNVAAGKIVVKDRTHKHGVSVPYLESGLRASIDSEKQLFECHAEGIGEFTADGRLTKLTTVHSLEIVDVTEDARVARQSLEALANLEVGWVDGEVGEAIADSVIERGHAVIAAMLAIGNFTRTIFPTEEGGIRFYWPEAQNQLSIEVEPSGSIYVHSADIEAGTFDESTISADVADLSESLDSWLSEDAANE